MLQEKSWVVTLPSWITDRTRTLVGILEPLLLCPSVPSSMQKLSVTINDMSFKKEQDAWEDISITQRKNEAKYTCMDSQAFKIPIFILSKPQRNFYESR